MESREPISSSSLRRVVLASFVGTTIEWYDFFLYGTASALVFNKLFFPRFEPLSGVMASYATYAVGFLARPFGGMVFGHFGDRLGRKSMLIISLALMGVATFLIGLLPTYKQIGIAAPILLVSLRFVQGLGVGGEWGGAVLMAVEHGSGGRRGLYGSWVQSGASAGLLLATAAFSLVSLLDDKAQLVWGWRVPFLLGILLLGVGLFIRLSVLESPLFASLKEKKERARIPLIGVLKNYPGNLLLGIGARFAENGCYYIFTVFVLTYATEHVKLLDRTVILNGILLASALHFVLIPTFGHLSDLVGRRPVYLCGAFALALFAFLFFWLIDTRSLPLIWLALVVALLIHAVMYGPQAALLAELFHTDVRFSGVSVGYHFSSVLAGGLAPFIATALLKWAHAPWPVAMYLVGMAAITIVSVWLLAETHRSTMR